MGWKGGRGKERSGREGDRKGKRGKVKEEGGEGKEKGGKGGSSSFALGRKRKVDAYECFSLES